LQPSDEQFLTYFDFNSENGKHLNFRTFRDFLQKIRAEISNRMLLSEEVIVGAVAEDGTAQVAHKPVFRGIRNKDGKLVEVSIVAVAIAAADEPKGRGNMESKVQVENLVLVVKEVED
jgi:hypothetical protein